MTQSNISFSQTTLMDGLLEKIIKKQTEHFLKVPFKILLRKLMFLYRIKLKKGYLLTYCRKI